MQKFLQTKLLSQLHILILDTYPMSEKLGYFFVFHAHLQVHITHTNMSTNILVCEDFQLQDTAAIVFYVMKSTRTQAMVLRVIILLFLSRNIFFLKPHVKLAY